MKIKQSAKKSISLMLAMLMLMSCWVFTPPAKAVSYDWSLQVTNYEDFYAKNLKIVLTDKAGATVEYGNLDSNVTYSGGYSSNWLKMFEPSADTTSTFSGTSSFYPVKISFQVQQVSNDSTVEVGVIATVNGITQSSSRLTTNGNADDMIFALFNYSQYAPSDDFHDTGYKFYFDVTDVDDNFTPSNLAIEVTTKSGSVYTIYDNVGYHTWGSAEHQQAMASSWRVLDQFKVKSNKSDMSFSFTLDEYPAGLKFKVQNSDQGGGAWMMDMSISNASNASTKEIAHRNIDCWVEGRATCSIAVNLPTLTIAEVRAENGPTATESTPAGVPFRYSKDITYDSFQPESMQVELGDWFALNQFGVRLPGAPIITINSNAAGVQVENTNNGGLNTIGAVINKTAQSAGTASSKTIGMTIRFEGATVGNVTYTGGFNAYIDLNLTDANYTYTYHLNDGSVNPVIDTQNYDTPASYEIPQRDGYDFNGYFEIRDTDDYSSDTSGLGAKLERGTGITSNKTWYASWTAKTYTFDFTNTLDNSVESFEIQHGQTIGNFMSGITNLNYVSNGQDNHEKFLGWFDAQGIKLDTTATADSDKSFTSNFTSENHTLSKWTDKDLADCTHNATEKNYCIYCGETFEREVENSALGHNFTELIETVEPELNVQGYKIYKCSRCDETKKVYTGALVQITFDLGNGEVLTFEVLEGKSMSDSDIDRLMAATVVKDNAQPGVNYEFYGWQTADQIGTDKYKTNIAMGGYVIKDSETLTPYFNETFEQFTVTYDVNGESYELTLDYGTNLYEAFANEYGTPESYEEESAYFVFDSWKSGDDKLGEDTVVTDNMNVTASFARTVKTYTVTVDGVEYTVNHGEKLDPTIITNETPTKAFDDDYHYAFSKWTVDGEDTQSIFDMIITADVEVEAYFTQTAHTMEKTDSSTDSTCTVHGYLVEKCTDCDHETSTKLDLIAHNSDEVVVESEVGEDSYGITHFNCSMCHETQKTETIPALRRVIFTDYNGDVIFNELITEGETLTAQTATNTYSDETYNYTFAVWVVGESEINFDTYTVPAINGGVSFTPKYSKVKIDYTVDFTDELGSHDDIIANYGDEIVLPEISAEQVIDHKTYTFLGWFDGETKVNSPYAVVANTSLVSKYDITDVEYQVSFDGFDSENVSGIFGSTITLPQVSKGEVGEYTFVGWKISGDDTLYNGEYTISGDVTFNAEFTKNQYTVTFEIETQDSNVQTVDFGTSIKHLAPTVEDFETADYAYKFIGWTIDGADLDAQKVTGNVTVVAVFEKTLLKQEVIVTYTDENGTVLGEKTLIEGSKFDPTLFIPSVYHDETNHYTFSNWTIDGVVVDENTTIDESTTVVANYTAQAHDLSYVVIHQPVGENAGAAKHYCTFGNCGYESEEIKLYNVVFTVDGEVKYTVVKQEGETLTADELPTVEKEPIAGVKYEFAHWEIDGSKNDFETAYKVSGYTNVVAVFNPIYFYTVTFTEGNGKVTKRTVQHGYMPELPTTPKSYTDDMYVYSFDTWSPEVVSATSDAAYTAVYTKELKKITVHFAIDNQLIDQEHTVTAGDSIMDLIPEFEKLVITDKNHSTFTAWTVKGVEIDMDDAENVLNVVKSSGDTLYIEAKFKTSNHSYGMVGEVVQTATCQRPELSKCTCTVCDFESTIQTAPKTDHKYVFVNRVDATETETAYDLYKCEYCDAEKRVPVTTEPEIPDIPDPETLDCVFGPFIYTDKNPAAGITVILYKDGKKVVGGTTDRYGYTELEVPAAGEYVVVLDGSDFKTVTTSVVIDEDGNVDMGSIPAIERIQCDCACHQNTFWGAIFRFFQKIVKLFTGRYTCCNNPDALYHK